MPDRGDIGFRIAIVLGAPRSGTTLLRTLLGSHSKIAALPETPWLMGSYGGKASLRSLRHRLTHERHGVVHNIKGMTADDVDRACHQFLDALFGNWLTAQGKDLLVIKTPDDTLFLDALIELFPHARYLHIVRDPRDVTISTMGRFDSLSGYGEATAFNCLHRWLSFEKTIRDTLQNRDNYHRVTYEDLVENTDSTLDPVCEFLGVTPERLRIDLTGQDLPDWEQGSRDVKRSGGHIANNTRRYESVRLSPEQRQAFNACADDIARFGYPERHFDVGAPDRARLALHGVGRKLRAALAWRYRRARRLRGG